MQFSSVAATVVVTALHQDWGASLTGQNILQRQPVEIRILTWSISWRVGHFSNLGSQEGIEKYLYAHYCVLNSWQDKTTRFNGYNFLWQGQQFCCRMRLGLPRVLINTNHHLLPLLLLLLPAVVQTAAQFGHLHRHQTSRAVEVESLQSWFSVVTAGTTSVCSLTFSSDLVTISHSQARANIGTLLTLFAPVFTFNTCLMAPNEASPKTFIKSGHQNLEHYIILLQVACKVFDGPDNSASTNSTISTQSWTFYHTIGRGFRGVFGDIYHCWVFRFLPVPSWLYPRPGNWQQHLHHPPTVCLPGTLLWWWRWWRGDHLSVLPSPPQLSHLLRIPAKLLAWGIHIRHRGSLQLLGTPSNSNHHHHHHDHQCRASGGTRGRGTVLSLGPLIPELHSGGLRDGLHSGGILLLSVSFQLNSGGIRVRLCESQAVQSRPQPPVGSGCGLLGCQILDETVTTPEKTGHKLHRWTTTDLQLFIWPGTDRWLTWNIDCDKNGIYIFLLNFAENRNKHFINNKNSFRNSFVV